MATADGLSTPRIADLHCHYPMHLPSAADEAPAPPVNRALREPDPEPEGGRASRDRSDAAAPEEWVDRLRLALLRWAAKVLSDETPESGWRVDFDRVRSGGVRLVFSVLYQPFAEIDIGRWPEGRPESGYAADLCAQARDRQRGPPHAARGRRARGRRTRRGSGPGGARRPDRVRPLHRGRVSPRCRAGSGLREREGTRRHRGRVRDAGSPFFRQVAKNTRRCRSSPTGPTTGSSGSGARRSRTSDGPPWRRCTSTAS